MAKSAPPIYCPDSCCIIDWLTSAPDHPDGVKAMSLLLSDAEDGKCRIVVPAVVVAELLPGKCGPRFPRFLFRLKSSARIIVEPMGFPIAKAAAELRDDLGSQGGGRSVDFMILATAMRAGANILYTGDKRVLNLNGRVAKLKRNRPAAGFQIRKIEDHLRRNA